MSLLFCPSVLFLSSGKMFRWLLCYINIYIFMEEVQNEQNFE